MHYIGFDIHKKVISFCEKKITGEIVEQGMISATREALTDLEKTRKHPGLRARGKQGTLCHELSYVANLSHDDNRFCS